MKTMANREAARKRAAAIRGCLRSDVVGRAPRHFSGEPISRSVSRAKFILGDAFDVVKATFPVSRSGHG